MPSIRVKADLEEWPLDSLKELAQPGGPTDRRNLIVYGRDEFELGGIPRGMQSGATSVMMAFPLPGGKVMIVETSLAALNAAVTVLNARYPNG